MPNYRRSHAPGAIYFFTLATLGRKPILMEDPVRVALRHAIQQVRVLFPFVIDGWVLLPDHMHCLWCLPEGDADFGKRWGMIKRLVTRELGCRGDLVSLSRRTRHEGSLWQRRFWEHQIRDEADYSRHLDYLHWNPVKHGYVQRVVDWPYSSFHRYVREGVLPVAWGGGNAPATGAFGE
ncbi:MAG: transposase [Gammaproteobacteria bacterium HGW-Gammaproteobacteria-1]|jgi:putative transposase|nr:MAG: transposase [Gammaproteobacteria bacterium HGW-Gammaproteobacteria-1]